MLREMFSLRLHLQYFQLCCILQLCFSHFNTHFPLRKLSQFSFIKTELLLLNLPTSVELGKKFWWLASEIVFCERCSWVLDVSPLWCELRMYYFSIRKIWGHMFALLWIDKKGFILNLSVIQYNLGSPLLCFMIWKMIKCYQRFSFTHWNKWQLMCKGPRRIEIISPNKATILKAVVISNEWTQSSLHWVFQCVSLGYISVAFQKTTCYAIIILGNQQRHYNIFSVPSYFFTLWQQTWNYVIFWGSLLLSGKLII